MPREISSLLSCLLLPDFELGTDGIFKKGKSADIAWSDHSWSLAVLFCKEHGPAERDLLFCSGGPSEHGCQARKGLQLLSRDATLI